MTKFVFVGCLYREDNLVEVPAGEVLVCTGDFSARKDGRDRVVQFNEWLGRQPHRHKLVVFGDQEIWCDTHEDEARRLLSNATVLASEMVELDGLKIYGSPWTPNSMTLGCGSQGHAFNEHDSYIEQRWASIPEGLDLLVTHCPPGLGGLAQMVRKTRPLVHCFSHGAGQSSSNHTVSINVELFTPEGVVVDKAQAFEFCCVG